MPLGEPLLMWAATKDGHIPAELLAARDREMKMSLADLRKKRAVHGPVPQIEFPTSVDAVGRQWTNDGPDVKPQK